MKTKGLALLFTGCSVPTSEMEKLMNELIKDELIEYDKYCGNHGISPDLLSPEKNVDEFLKLHQ